MRKRTALPSAVRHHVRSAAAGGVSGARSVLAALRRLNAVDIAQLHAKLAAAAWSIALFFRTPDVLAASLGSVLVWCLTGMVLSGALVSATGLIVSARDRQPDPIRLRSDLRRSLRGLGIELTGLILMLAGVSLYFLSQAALSFGPTGDQRFALSFFAYFTGAMIIGRLAAVLHRRRKETVLAKAIGGTT